MGDHMVFLMSFILYLKKYHGHMNFIVTFIKIHMVFLLLLLYNYQMNHPLI